MQKTKAGLRPVYTIPCSHMNMYLNFASWTSYTGNALLTSQLDYCNSFFKSLSKFRLHKLQCIQNSAARIVSNTSRYTSITPVLKILHWLPVEYGSVFKTATLVYNFLHTGFPKYFAPYISSYSSLYQG